MTEMTSENIVASHPCLSEGAHLKFARIHMPIAPKCNIQCKYCIRKFDCVNESRPGVSSLVLDPWEAIGRIRVLVERTERLKVVGVAGPGDPLANETTFTFFRMLSREFPELIPCVSTNGLLLRDRLEDLLGAGVRSITVTVNAIEPKTAEGIYSHISLGGRLLRGTDAARELVRTQWAGVALAARAGAIVKLNTIYIPGVNEHEIPFIAARAAHMGIEVMNVMPLIPQAAFAHLERPNCGQLDGMRKKCGKHVRQMAHCKQCRADAFGLLGEDGDAELEVVNAGIGEDYCEMVV